MISALVSETGATSDKLVLPGPQNPASFAVADGGLLSNVQEIRFEIELEICSCTTLISAFVVILSTLLNRT